LVPALLSGLFAFSEAAGEAPGAQSRLAKPINSNPVTLKWKRPGALPPARPSHMTLEHEPLTPLAMLITP
jgi:hypothetical protein